MAGNLPPAIAFRTEHLFCALLPSLAAGRFFCRSHPGPRRTTTTSSRTATNQREDEPPFALRLQLAGAILRPGRRRSKCSCLDTPHTPKLPHAFPLLSVGADLRSGVTGKAIRWSRGRIQRCGWSLYTVRCATLPSAWPMSTSVARFRNSPWSSTPGVSLSVRLTASGSVMASKWASITQKP